jgi:hypothetical protein
VLVALCKDLKPSLFADSLHRAKTSFQSHPTVFKAASDSGIPEDIQKMFAPSSHNVPYCILNSFSFHNQFGDGIAVRMSWYLIPWSHSAALYLCMYHFT